MRGYIMTNKIKSLAVIAAAAWSAAPTLVKAQLPVSEGGSPFRTQTLEKTPNLRNFNAGYAGGSMYSGTRSGNFSPAFGPTASGSWIASDSFVDPTTSFLTGPSWSTATNWGPTGVPDGGGAATLTTAFGGGVESRGDLFTVLDVDVQLGTLTLGNSAQTQIYSSAPPPSITTGASGLDINAQGFLRIPFTQSSIPVDGHRLSVQLAGSGSVNIHGN